MIHCTRFSGYRENIFVYFPLGVLTKHCERVKEKEHSQGGAGKVGGGCLVVFKFIA